MGLEKRVHVNGLGMWATPSKTFCTFSANVTKQAVYASEERYWTTQPLYDS